MASNSLKTVPKTSVQIWQPILDKLEAKIKRACLRRDPYLEKVLDTELDYLDDEVSLANSQASFDFVSSRLRQLGNRKLVSLALPPKLTRRLNEICMRKRIVRDAFFNRLFLLLAASPRSIDMLLFGGEKRWRADVWSEHKHDEAFFQNGFYPLEASIDPFWAIRAGLEMSASDAGLETYLDPQNSRQIRVKRDLSGAIAPADSLYTTIFEQKVAGNDLLGLSCYLPDWRIPDHETEQKHRAKLDELLADLMSSP